MSQDFQIIQFQIDPEAIKKLPNRQRNQLVGCMHAHNELVVLNRLLMFSLNDVAEGHSLLPASTSESWRQNWSDGACTPEVAQRGQVSAGAAGYEFDNSASVRPICTLQRAGVSGGISEPFVWHRRRYRSRISGKWATRRWRRIS
jgi:hypothetical protein